MVEPTPVPIPAAEVEDHPTKPYKAYAAAVAAFLTVLLTIGLDLPAWLEGVILAVVAGLSAYIVPNPKRIKAKVKTKGRKTPPHTRK